MNTLRSTRIFWTLRLGVAALMMFMTAPAAESPYEIAYESLHILEEEGFNIRQDYYQKPLDPSVGKGVRVQLFKGNEYAFVGALAEDGPASSLKIQVLDSEGHVVVQETDPIVKGRVVIVKMKPNRTGYYVVAMRQVSSKARICALFMGFR